MIRAWGQTPQRPIGTRRPSCDTWQWFVHPVPLIVTHDARSQTPQRPIGTRWSVELSHLTVVCTSSPTNCHLPRSRPNTTKAYRSSCHTWRWFVFPVPLIVTHVTRGQTPKRPIGTRWSSCHTWQWFVHPVPLIVTHETLFSMKPIWNQQGTVKQNML